MFGRAAKWIGGGSLRTNALVGGVAATAAGVGAMSAVLDRSGPYADLQEFAFGDPEAFRYSMKAGVSAAISPRHRDLSRHGPTDNYYGQPVNPQVVSPRGVGRTTPVPGDVVLGGYNMRRG